MTVCDRQSRLTLRHTTVPPLNNISLPKLYSLAGWVVGSDSNLISGCPVKNWLIKGTYAIGEQWASVSFVVRGKGQLH